VLASGAITLVSSRLRSGAARAIPALATLVSAALLQVPALARRMQVEPLHTSDWGLTLAGVLLLVALPLELRVRASRARR